MKKKSILFKLLGVVGACLAAVMMIVGAVIMLIQYQNRVVDMQNEQLASIAENVATMTELVTREYINDLESLSSTSAFTEADDALTRGNSEVMSRFIDSYYYKKKGILGGIFLTDPTGKELVGTTDFPAVIYSYSMGDTDTGVSVVVREDEGRNCYLELSVETENQNRLIYLLDARELYAQTAAHTKVGDKGYVMIKDNNGRIIMHPVEDQIGIDVLEDRKKSHPDFDFSDLEVLIAKQNSGQSGIERYNSYWWADEVPRRVEKISAYTPAWVGDGFLVISAVMDYEEIAGPVRSGAIGLMAMTGAIIIVLLLSGIFLIENYKKRMKVLKENLYLKEVNMKLTEIHKQEEKLAHQQRLQTIGTLTSGIAHEFSNLLTPIMGYSMMLLQSMEITDENYEDMETIYTSSVKAKEIIDQIASFSGKNIQQTFQNLSASRVVENAVRMVESVRPKAIKLELDMGENASIYGNPTQMQQIILNLCTNAFHAMQDQESGVLKIQTRLTGKKRQKYEITVTDNGCGMDEATQKQIFDPFFTTKKTGEGTGLGLSIVQRIVENHNGTIDVESRLGEGTTFTLKFPVL